MDTAKSTVDQYCNSGRTQLPTVLYDGECPLCRREIAHYRRLRGAECIDWVDITQDESVLSGYGLNREIAMARFHVRDRTGDWQTGAWGFTELWSHLPAYRWLARTLRVLRLEPLLDRAYRGFAHWRLRRRCDASACGPTGR